MRRNIFIFVLDTVRRSLIRGIDTPLEAGNFLENILQKGILFENFIVAGGTTRISVNALFNGFYGETSGLNFHHCQEEFPLTPALSITELFKYHGYQTIGATQGDISLQPAGFDHLWERQETFDLDTLSSLLNKSDQPSFTYLHFYHVHDQAFGFPESMTTENYRVLVNELAEEIESVWKSLVQKNDLVVIASDHGCRLRDRLDDSWRFYDEEEPTAGTFLTDQTIRGICSIIAPGHLPALRIRNLTRGIDIFPTLCDALGIERPEVQGYSLWPALQGKEAFPVNHAFIETGGVRMANGQAIGRCVRTTDWKYIHYHTHGEQLFDLRHDPSERQNLTGSGHPQETVMRSLFTNQAIENRQGVKGFYSATESLCRKIMAQRRSSASPVSRGKRNFSFQQPTDRHVQTYLKKHLARHLPLWKKRGERILIYSASEHTRNVFILTKPDERSMIVGVIDSNPDLWGDDFFGVPIYPPQDFEKKARPTMIIVGHHVYANDMYARIKDSSNQPVPVYNLYHLDREIPLWWDQKYQARQDQSEN